MLEPLPPRDGVRVLRVVGELDVLSAQPLHDQVSALVDAGPLVLDLAGVTFFDSSAVHAVDRLARAYAAGGFRVVAPPGGRPRRVLDLVGLGDGLVTDDLEQAIAQLRG